MSHLLAIAVGNTRTRIGLFANGELSTTSHHASADARAVVEAIEALAVDHPDMAMVMSTVNTPASREIEALVSGTILHIGRDVPVPMTHTLDDASTLGQDRMVCAFGAFRKVKQACIIIDAGTAITVDFVDGAGTFHGGAIAPGVNAMLRAMHASTASLPVVEYVPMAEGAAAYGKETRSAMLLGVRAAAIGMAHYLIDRYADAYQAYPQIVATGGDAQGLFANDEIVEHIVPDLQLLGLYEACKAAEERDEAGGEDEGDEGREGEIGHFSAFE